MLYTHKTISDFAKDPAVAEFAGRWFLYHSTWEIFH